MDCTIQITNRLAVLLIISILVIGCNDVDKIDVEGQSEGRLQVSITDAPVDDPNVEAVFITTVAIELDGNLHTSPLVATDCAMI